MGTAFDDYERRYLEICDNLCTRCAPDGGAPNMAVLRADLKRAEALAKVMDLEARQAPVAHELLSRLKKVVTTLRHEQHKAMNPKREHKAMNPKRDLECSTIESLTLAMKQKLDYYEKTNPSILSILQSAPCYGSIIEDQCKKTTMESSNNNVVGCWKKMNPFRSF